MAEADWVRPDRCRKDTSCRVAILRMHRCGLIVLPVPPSGTAMDERGRGPPQLPVPRRRIGGSAGKLGRGTGAGCLTPLERTDRDYHYLGCKPPPGARLRCFVFAGGRRLAALGFGAAAGKAHLCHSFIGWTPRQRVRNLHLIVSSARFLILPGWVARISPRAPSATSCSLPEHWQTHYGCRPVLLETSATGSGSAAPATAAVTGSTWA
ncbi:MAG: Druantia anti-phage system protein DruA [Planctomycetota bacterium]